MPAVAITKRSDLCSAVPRRQGVEIHTIWCMLGCMRTNIDIDDEILKEVQRLTGIRTKRGAVDLALRELVARHRRLGLLKLRGKVRWEGDLSESRADR